MSFEIFPLLSEKFKIGGIQTGQKGNRNRTKRTFSENDSQLDGSRSILNISGKFPPHTRKTPAHNVRINYSEHSVEAF